MSRPAGATVQMIDRRPGALFVAEISGHPFPRVPTDPKHHESDTTSTAGRSPNRAIACPAGPRQSPFNGPARTPGSARSAACRSR